MANKLYEFLSFDNARMVVERVESNGGEKSLVMKGIFIQGEVKNQNQRVYPLREIDKAVNSINRRLNGGETILGELDHPQELTINLDRVSHMITEMWIEGRNGYGKLKVLQTPMGSIAKTLLESGAKLGVSSRGAGNVNESGTVSDFDIVTVDIVAQPSAPDAYPRTVYESLFNMRGGQQVYEMAAESVQCKKAEKHLIKNIRKLIDELRLQQESIMEEIIKELLEQNISDDAKEQISEAWNAKLKETKEQLTAELREEFAQRYEHDKGMLIDAMDKFLNQKIAEEVKELDSDRQALIKEKVNYRKRLKEQTKMLNKFITEQVAKEVKELRQDRVKTNESVNNLEDFVIKQIASEIKDFHNDKKDLAEQKVKLVRESKKQIAEAKNRFIKKASTLVEGTINKVLKDEISQYKEDIKLARQNDFGRRIFEAFAGEYMTSYLSEGSEIRKFEKVLEGYKKQLEEQSSEVKKQKLIAEQAIKKAAIMEDRISRDKILNKLFAPLNREKRKIMEELLQNVKATKLEEQFNKYLPAVLNDEIDNSTKRVLSEGHRTEKTGNRETIVSEQDRNLVIELQQLKQLAGIL